MTVTEPSYPNTLEACHRLLEDSHHRLESTRAQMEELQQLQVQILKRVEELEKENRALRARLESNSNNSSKPPSSDFKKPKKRKRSSGKSSGGQKGHRGHFRALVDESEVDNIVDCDAFKACEHCGGEMISTGHRVRHQVHELPTIKRPITEYGVSIGRCRRCHHKQMAPLPQGVSWGMTGPRLTSFMAILVAKYQLSRRALQEFLKEHFHFKLSLGTVFNKQRLVNRVLEQPVNELLNEVKQSQAVHMDETGHRQWGQKHWTWVVASQSTAYYKITKSRGKK